jgi:hypothetical protein
MELLLVVLLVLSLLLHGNSQLPQKTLGRLQQAEVIDGGQPRQLQSGQQPQAVLK